MSVTNPGITTGECVYVVEDDADLQRSLAWTLTSVKYCVEAFGSADEFKKVVDCHKPGCVVLDLLLPGITGLQLCRQLRAAKSPLAVALISAHGDIPSAVQCLRLGAVDFLEKPFGRERLLQAVNEGIVRSRQEYADMEEEEMVSQRLALLSQRERQILDCMTEGLITKEIAKRLDISPRTVDVHRSQIKQKLGLRSSAQVGHLLYVEERRRRRAEGWTGAD